jgi:hypothetical protein
MLTPTENRPANPGDADRSVHSSFFDVKLPQCDRRNEDADAAIRNETWGAELP